MLTISDLQARVAKVPRVKLATLPTPLHPMGKLSDLLGVPVYVKRDDLTGLAFGGNKTRMFEFLLAQAVREGADCVIAGAQAQSNYCRQIAAACGRLGMDCYLPLRRIRGHKDNEVQGNLFLDLLMGAHVVLIDTDMDGQQEVLRNLTSRLRKAGRKPFMTRFTEEHIALESIGYVECFIEIVNQCQGANITPTHIYVSAYDATQAGLELAAKAVGSTIEVVGIAPGNWEHGKAPTKMAKYGNQAARMLDLDVELNVAEILNSEEFAGTYGYPTPETLDAIQKVARAEGIFLDPVYTGKAMAGLINHIEQGHFTSSDIVVFLHTGGTPSIFAYTEELQDVCVPLANSVEEFLV